MRPCVRSTDPSGISVDRSGPGAASNVVILDRHLDRLPGRRASDEPALPARDLQAHERPAPPAPRSGWNGFLLLLAASSALHGGLVVGFGHTAPPSVASVGEEVISIELVVGADSNAGSAAQSEAAQESSAAEPVKDRAEFTDQTARATAEIPEQREPERPQIEDQPPDTAKVARAPVPAEAEAVQIREPPPPEETPPVEARVEPAEPPTRPEPPTRREANPPQSQASMPSAASRGVGRGRSANDPGYNARVVAHLARFKRFPPEARNRRSQGNAVVAFAIDAEGRVTSVRLVTGAGIPALDREAVAMVERASPFPQPPGGQGKTFTAPVAFQLR